jgi:hypothetical protein
VIPPLVAVLAGENDQTRPGLLLVGKQGRNFFGSGIHDARCVGLALSRGAI